MTHKSTTEANIAAWDQFGEDFVGRAVISRDDIHYGLCIPGEKELRLLPELGGRRVLDVGCGSGENGTVLARMGAHVVGVEPAPSLWRRASATFPPPPRGIVLNEAWGGEGAMSRAPYDIVLFVGSSEYIPLDAAFFRTLGGVTVPGSYLLMARMHPFWTCLFCHETGGEARRPYFDHGRQDRVEYGHMRCGFVRFHYALGDLVQCFREKGWQLQRLVEPAPVPADRAPFHVLGCYEDPVLAERLRDIPMTVVLTFCRS